MDDYELMPEQGNDRGESARIDELLRVNTELAAELRALTAGRSETARKGRVPAARGVARLHAEREALRTQLEETQAALRNLEGVQAALEEVSRERERLGVENAKLTAEVARLRVGWRGIARRLRGRLSGPS